MNFFSKPITISLSPNTEKDDIRLALKLIFQFLNWKNWKRLKTSTGNEKVNSQRILEEEFKNYLGVKYAFAFNSGRSAYMAVLNSLKEILRGSDLSHSGEGLTSSEFKDDEILLQAYTCNAGVNPIIWSGFKPIFVDVDETLNLDPKDLKRKITPRSRVVVIQHTSGNPAKIDEILEICRQNNLILIEDCAHSLGAKYKGKFCGTFGRGAFFSFSRDKVISSIFGGMAVTNDSEMARRIKDFQKKCSVPSNFWVLQQLLHPILVNYLILPLYGFFGLGRWVLTGFQKLKILSKAVHKVEKQGKRPSYFPKKMPNALAILALNQFKKLEKFNQHRREIAEFYNQELKDTDFISPSQNGEGEPIFMRYSVLLPSRLNSDEVLEKARKQSILLDDGWRKTPIVPPDTNLEKMNYILGSCPRAEKIAKTILNLPTHINISKKDAQKIINFLKNLS